MPQISVISTVYNGTQYLEDYFLSLASQSFTDYELILIDDGSTDGSGDICDRFAKKDSRVRVFHQNNQGLGAARNIAVGYACTDWITFVDCDDVIHPDYLKTLYKGVKEYGALLCGVGVFESENISFDNETDVSLTLRRYVVDEDFIMSDLCSGFFGQIGCAKLIYKDILINNPFTKGRLFEDNAVVKKWICDAENVVYIDRKLYCYRINNLGLSKGELTIEKVQDILWARDEIINYYKHRGFNKAYCQAEQRYIMSSIDLYFKLHKINRSNSRTLKKQIVERYNEDKSFINFSKENKLFVFEMKHPVLMWLYWKLKSMM